MPKTCPYCRRSGVKFSREHLISRSVLIEAFGDPISSITSGSLFGGKTLVDAEPTTKNVCRDCNSDLSPYDDEAALFAREIFHHASLIGVSINLNLLRLNWILKTHLNYLSITKSQLTNVTYPLHSDIHGSIISQKPVPHDLYRLGIETIEASPDHWGIAEEGKTRLHYFRYISVEFRAQRTIVSDLRLKSFWSYLILPADNDYWLFKGRAAATIAEMKNLSFDPQWLNVINIGSGTKVELTKYLPKQILFRLLDEEKKKRQLQHHSKLV
jgi:hypothetical protein